MSNDISHLFAKRLREIRKIKGLSQEALAEKSNVHDTTISLIERAVGHVKLDTVEKLANGLGVNIGDFFLHFGDQNIQLKNKIISLLANKDKKQLEKIIKLIEVLD